MNRLLVIPRWFYPNNLGDSIVTTAMPAAFKSLYPNDLLTVCTSGELLNVFCKHPLVDEIVVPSTELLAVLPNVWKEHALHKTHAFPPNMHIVWPEWHPHVWDFWNGKFDFFANHPTANLLTVNMLLQLNMLSVIFNKTNLRPIIPITKQDRETRTLAIVPATKLSGRPDPHPGCDGKGMRFNGDNGQSWQLFVKTIKQLDSSIKIIEFSYENFGFGDEHIPHKEDWFELAKECAKPTVAVLSDGGMHHMFNSQLTPVVLLGAQTINKPYFFQLSNSIFYEDLHSKCLNKCDKTIRSLTGWPDLHHTCDGSCQTVDPVSLANKVYEDFLS
jgi:hypothetical protein